jgi:hypothetical protein
MAGQRTLRLSRCTAFHVSECFDYIKLEKFMELEKLTVNLSCLQQK